MAALVALGVGARIVLWRDHGGDGQEQGYMAWIYYSTLCRFDEFIPGVAIAMLKNFHRPAWDRLMAHGRAIFAVGAVATLAMLTAADVAYFADGGGYRFFMTAFGYSLLALSFALLVTAALSPVRTPLAWRVPGAASIALWSYSIYLSHKPLAIFLAHQLKPLDPPEAVRVAAVTLACVVLGGLLHRFVETPFMALRDRCVPSNFQDAGDDRASRDAIGGAVSPRAGASP
jgi:peptidoglycan/LPS O-acetylase OafA/YrhL